MQVLLVDDHPAARAGMRSFLESTGECLVAGEAATVADAIRQAEELRPDAVVLDLVLPDGSAMDFLERMGGGGEGMAVLVVSGYPLSEMRERLAAQGARGFYSKVDGLEELLAGLREAAAGGEFASRSVSREVEEEWIQTKMQQAGMSKQQIAVMTLLAQGRSAKEAAEILQITEVTVLMHKRRALQKLGARKSLEAVGKLLAPWKVRRESCRQK